MSRLEFPLATDLKRHLVWILALACSSCSDSAELTWVEEIPSQGFGVEAFSGYDTWVDLLAVPVIGSEATTVELVELKAPAEKVSGAAEMQRGRDGKIAVLSDQRRAWVTPINDSMSFEVEIERGGRLLSSFGFVTDSNAALPAGVTISFGVEFDSGSGTHSVSRGRALPSTQFQWIDVLGDVSGPGRLRFVASVVGEHDADLSISAVFATPALQLESSRVPDVVIVSVDTLRADRLGAYGYERGTSPNIDRLAARGVLFEQCMSQAPWTLPSYGSLFTSLYPAEHRAGISEKAEIWTKGGAATDYSKLGQKLIADVPTLAGELSKAGYRTASFYFNPYLGPQTGVARGFDEYAFMRYSANAGVDRALEWLKFNEGMPRFLFLQLIDPHWPYAPPAPFDQNFAGRDVESIDGYPWALPSIRNNVPPDKKQKLLSDLYDGEIAYTDAELGRLFDYFESPGSLGQVLTIFHSDHGEEFWEHGQFEHGHSMHSELLRVPLIVSMPKMLAPLRVEESVRSIDIFPTVLDLLGLTRPEGLRGSSLLPMARGDVEGLALVGFAESILWGRPYASFDEAKTLVTDDWKLVVGDGDSEDQLYRLSDDPEELKNLASARPEDVAFLKRRLIEKHEQASNDSNGETLEFDQSAQDQLDNLGYIAGDEEDQAPDSKGSSEDSDSTGDPK